MSMTPKNYYDRESRPLKVQRDDPAEIERRKLKVLAESLATLRKFREPRHAGDAVEREYVRIPYRVSG